MSGEDQSTPLRLTKQGSRLGLIQLGGASCTSQLRPEEQQPAAAPLPLAGPITGDLLDTALAPLFEANLTTLVTWLDVSGLLAGPGALLGSTRGAVNAAGAACWMGSLGRQGGCCRLGRRGGSCGSLGASAPFLPLPLDNPPCRPARPTSLQQEVPDLVNQLLSSEFAGTLCECASQPAGLGVGTLDVLGSLRPARVPACAPNSTPARCWAVPASPVRPAPGPWPLCPAL